MHNTNEAKIQFYRNQVTALTDKIDCIFSGKTAVFLPYTHKGLHYSENMTQDFINHLIAGFEKETGECFPSAQKMFYGSFIRFAVLFCELQCNDDEWTFESIIKLSRTLEKNEFGTSTADILFQDLMEEHTNDLNAPQSQANAVCQAYSTLSELYTDNYHPDFADNISLMIDLFLDNNHISLFSNESNFSYALSILHTALRRIRRIQMHTIGGTNEQ